MQLDDFRNQTPAEIEKIFLDHQFSQQRIKNFKKAFRNQSVTDLSALKEIRQLKRIIHLLPFQPLLLVDTFRDQRGNEKFVFQTNDGYRIESVLMPDKKNVSICVSMQVGCKLGCTICQTGHLGFKRNLQAHEILDQIRQIYQQRIYPELISCISFMGMGEPFDNLSQCLSALDWITSSWGWQISPKKITFSTSGCLPFDRFLAVDQLPNLAVSLHSADEVKRRKMMPQARIRLAELKTAMIRYTGLTRKYISLEYCLIKGLNDSLTDADALILYVKDLPCKINLLNYNPISSGSFEPVAEEDLYNFKDYLERHHLNVLYRKSLGLDVAAGCGQLGISFD